MNDPITYDRSRRLARMRERDAVRTLLVVGISREHSPRRSVELRDDVEVLAVARRAEHPLVIGEDAQGSDLMTVVGDREQGEFHRIVGVDEDVQFVADAARVA